MRYGSYNLVEMAGPGGKSGCLQISKPTYVDLGRSSWFILIPNALSVSQDEFESLWQAHPATQDSITVFGKTHKIPRFQRLYADSGSYRYSGKTMKAYPLQHPLLLRALAQANGFEKQFDYNGILVNWYQSGLHSMGLHADDEPELKTGAPIYSYSFGASRIFRIRQFSQKASEKIRIDVLLENQSLLIMGGKMQRYFKHELPKSRSVSGARINLTIRAFNSVRVD